VDHARVEVDEARWVEAATGIETPVAGTPDSAASLAGKLEFFWTGRVTHPAG